MEKLCLVILGGKWNDNGLLVCQESNGTAMLSDFILQDYNFDHFCVVCIFRYR